MGGSLCVIKHGWQIPQFPHEQWTQWRLSSSQRVTPKWTQRLSIGSIKNIGSTEVRRNGGMGFQRRISTGVSRVMTSFAHTSLPGWWYTYPSEKYARHLGWWHFQLNGRVKIPWFQSPPTSDVFQNDFLVAAFQAFWQRIPYSHGDSCVVIWAIQQRCYLSLHGWQVEELKFQWFHRFHWASGYIQIIQNSEKPWKREHLVWFCCEKLCKSECIPCQNCALKQVKSLRCGLISSTMDSDSTEIFRNRYIMISDIYWLLEVAALDHPLAEKNQSLSIRQFSVPKIPSNCILWDSIAFSQRCMIWLTQHDQYWPMFNHGFHVWFPVNAMIHSHAIASGATIQNCGTNLPSQDISHVYPLVNIRKTMERSTMFNW